MSYFYDYSIVTFCDIVNIEPCAFINNCFNSNTFSLFAERFELVSESHVHNTKSSSKGLLFVPSCNISRFGRKSIICFATLIWNHLQNKYSNHAFVKLAPKALKNVLSRTHYIVNNSSAYFPEITRTTKHCYIVYINIYCYICRKDMICIWEHLAF